MGREAPSEPGNKRQIFTTTWFWKSSDWHGGRRGESAELAGVMPASALKARLKGPSELKPASSDGRDRHLGLGGVGERRLGVGNPIKVQEGGEVPVTQLLVDQLAQPVFRQAEPQGELTERQPLLTIGAVDGHRAFEGNGQRWVGRPPRRVRRRRAAGAGSEPDYHVDEEAA